MEISISSVADAEDLKFFSKNYSLRPRLFFRLWGGWGLLLLALLILATETVYTIPWFFVSDGAQVKDIFLTVIRQQTAYFWIALVLQCALGLAVVAILLLGYTQRHKMIPKTPQQILNCLLGGLPKGSIMISYTSRENGMYNVGKPFDTDKMLPRALARLLPGYWLDQDFVVPGGNLEKFCLTVAKKCIFGIIFVSDAYLTSDICIKEFLTLTNNWEFLPTLTNKDHQKKNMVLVQKEVYDYIFKHLGETEQFNAMKDIIGTVTYKKQDPDNRSMSYEKRKDKFWFVDDLKKWIADNQEVTIKIFNYRKEKGKNEVGVKEIFDDKGFVMRKEVFKNENYSAKNQLWKDEFGLWPGDFEFCEIPLDKQDWEKIYG